MNYAKWATEDEIKSILSKNNLKSDITDFGIPIMYDNENLYTCKKDSQTLVIGAKGSGKIQTVILPTINLAMKAGESIVVNDVKGELYETCTNELKNQGYNVILINFDDASKGNYWNPLDLVSKTMKKNKDKAEDLLNEIGSYIFYEESTSDNFWTNSATDLFSGIAYYLLKSQDKVSLKDISNLANDLNSKEKALEFLSKLDKNSSEYYHLVGVLNSPEETRASIVAVFNQSLNTYIVKENLSKLLSKSDFEISNINRKKTAVFIINKNNQNTNRLVSLIINQIYTAISENKDSVYTNFFLDDADSMYPIKNINKLIQMASGYKIKFILLIKSLMLLKNNYKTENLEMIQMCFDSILYLYTNDIFTLEKVSKLCGKDKKGESLISPEELKVMGMFEAIAVLPRMMPFKTKLIPNYKINWGYEVIKEDMPSK